MSQYAHIFHILFGLTLHGPHQREKSPKFSYFSTFQPVNIQLAEIPAEGNKVKKNKNKKIHL